MKKTMVQYVVTGTTDKCANDLLTKFDPQLLEEAEMYLKNIFGESITIIVEDVTIVEVEDEEDDNIPA